MLSTKTLLRRQTTILSAAKPTTTGHQSVINLIDNSCTQSSNSNIQAKQSNSMLNSSKLMMLDKTVTRRNYTQINKKFSTEGAAHTPTVDKPWLENRIMVVGCKGQVGVPMVKALCEELGNDQVVACDISDRDVELPCKFEKLDVCDKQAYERIIKDNKITYIVHLAAILSALGERQPDLALDVNVNGFNNALNLARDHQCKLFCPSSIAVFGGDIFPKRRTPVDTILQPRTIYGVSKVYNEMIGEYYADKFNLDFRSLRYPGVISSEKYAFNGTTDYATEIFFHALEKGQYDCWLKPKTALPMIYIDDAIKATIQFLKADRQRLRRNTYNLAGISFTPEELAIAVRRLIPGFEISYVDDYRQSIANQWPKSLDDSDSRIQWNWEYKVTVHELAEKILSGIDDSYKEGTQINL